MDLPLELKRAKDQWIKTRELLTELSQVLTPVPKFVVLSEEEGIPFIASSTAEKIMQNPFKRTGTTEQFSHAVRLLPTLEMVQKEIAESIKILPGEKGGAREPEKLASSKTEGLIQQGIRPHFVQRQDRESIPVKWRMAATGRDELSFQAKRLALEVRVAIHSLSTSSYLSDPKPATLRTALIKLKPLVDELIDSLAKTDPEPRREKLSAGRKPHAQFIKSEERAIESQALSPNRSLNKEENLSRAPQPGLPKEEEHFALRAKERRSGANDPSFLVLQAKQEGLFQSPIQRHTRGGAKLTPDLSNEEKIRILLSEGKEVAASSSKKREVSESPKTNVTPPPLLHMKQGSAATSDDLSEKNSFLVGKVSGIRSEETRPSPIKPSLPITLPIAATASNQALIGALKKKKRKRYFFKNDESEEDSNSSY